MRLVGKGDDDECCGVRVEAGGAGFLGGARSTSNTSNRYVVRRQIVDSDFAVAEEAQERRVREVFAEKRRLDSLAAAVNVHASSHAGEHEADGTLLGRRVALFQLFPRPTQLMKTTSRDWTIDNKKNCVFVALRTWRISFSISAGSVTFCGTTTEWARTRAPQNAMPKTPRHFL